MYKKLNHFKEITRITLRTIARSYKLCIKINHFKEIKRIKYLVLLGKNRKNISFYQVIEEKQKQYNISE